MALRAVDHIRVNDCYLEFPDRDNVRMPVAKFTVSFELDMLPTAEVVPSLGREIRSGTRVSLKDISEGDLVQLWLTINGDRRLILEGYIQSISGSDNATIFNRRLTASLTIKHKGVVLAGAPSASLAYTTAVYLDTTLLSYVKSGHPFFATGLQGGKISLLSKSEFAFSMQEAFGSPDIALYPGSVMKRIASELMTSYASEDEDVRDEQRAIVEELLDTYDPANLTDIPTATSFNLLESFAEKYLELWRTSNNWEALRRTAQYMFMHIVPYNNGLYLANPLSLMKTPSVEIRTRDYISLAQQVAATLTEPVDGVVIRVPNALGLDNARFMFPKPDKGAQAKLRYYHFREFPAWTHVYAEQMFGKITSQGVSETERAATQSTPNKENPAEVYQELGERLAQAIYADLRMRKGALRLTLPYREDLMPGTIVSVVSTGAEDMSFIGDTLYGMIKKTNIVCDMLQEKGMLNTFVEVVSVRNTKDNNDPNLALETHPIYEEPWVGIDLFGGFTLDQGYPEGVDDAPKATTKVNDRGRVVDREDV